MMLKFFVMKVVEAEETEIPQRDKNGRIDIIGTTFVFANLMAFDL